MKTAQEIIDKVYKESEDIHWDWGMVETAMKEYAREVLQDYDNWKAHKTPDLVKQYIKEKGL